MRTEKAVINEIGRLESFIAECIAKKDFLMASYWAAKIDGLKWVIK